MYGRDFRDAVTRIDGLTARARARVQSVNGFQVECPFRMHSRVL